MISLTHQAVIRKSIRTLDFVLSGHGAKLLELAVTRRVVHMLLQAILITVGLAARTFYPASAYDCISS
jgi:hypothetical protein